MAYFILFIIMMVIAGILAHKDIGEKNSARGAFYYEYSNRLHVYKKSAIATKALKVEANHEVYYKDVPDKLIYTGATVGGVTTGGFHVQQGGISVQLGSKTGEYRISYKYAREDVNFKSHAETIYFIELTDELMADARKDSVMKSLILSEEEVGRYKDFYHLKGSRSRNVINLLKLSKSQAYHVVSWLAGN